MRISRRIAAPLALSAIALAPVMAQPLQIWTAEFHQGTCAGPCCLITDGFFELSCGEYTPTVSPTPTIMSNPTPTVIPTPTR